VLLTLSSWIPGFSPAPGPTLPSNFFYRRGAGARTVLLCYCASSTPCRHLLTSEFISLSCNIWYPNVVVNLFQASLLLIFLTSLAAVIPLSVFPTPNDFRNSHESLYCYFRGLVWWNKPGSGTLPFIDGSAVKTYISLRGFFRQGVLHYLV